MTEQNTLDWHRQRLGYFTGSRIADLMVSGRKKDELFGKTAMTYIYEVAGERMMKPSFVADDEKFAEYLQLVHPTSKTMEWGHDAEDVAVEVMEAKTDIITERVGSTIHPTIPYFSASPDRLFTASDGTLGVLEVKCPMPKAFMQYRAEIVDATTLKAVRPEYYWQVMAEMMCTGRECAYFVAFCPFIKGGTLHAVLIHADQDAFGIIEERVTAANEIINTKFNIV